MKQSSEQRQRRVRFIEDPLVKVIEAMKEEERAVRWYTSNDLAAIRLDCGTCKNCSISHQKLDKDVPTCSCALSANREVPRDFVLSLLAQQWEHQQLGINDPRGLFQFSKACSKSSIKRAISKAKEDAEVARQISKEELDGMITSALDMLQMDDF